MEIIDRAGYLESALRYIGKNIISGRGLQKIAKKTGINEGLLKNLSLSLKKFSEKHLFTILHEKLEESHSSLAGATAEISGADISVESRKGRAFILMNIDFDIKADDETEDKIKIEARIFSRNNIYVN